MNRAPQFILLSLWLLVAWATTPHPAFGGGLDAAHQAREARDYGTAITLYRAAGDNTEALFWLGTVLRWTGDIDEAARVFDHLLTRNPDHVDGLLGDARVALRRGDAPRAERDLNRLLTLKPDYQDARELLFTVYRRQGRLKMAYHWAGQVFEGDERIRRRADIAFQLMWYHRAAAGYRTLITHRPDDPGPVLGLGRCNERMGYLNDAVRLYRAALERFPDHAAIQLRLAIALRGLRHYDDARETFDRILARNGTDTDALLGRTHLEMNTDRLGHEGGGAPLATAPRAEASAAVLATGLSTIEAALLALAGEMNTPVDPAAPDLPPESDTRSTDRPMGDAPMDEGPDPVPSVPEPAPVPVVKTVFHTVVAGDTLGTVAERHLGDSGLWQTVWKANPDLTNPDRLRVGQVLAVPVAAPRPVPAVTPAATPDQAGMALENKNKSTSRPLFHTVLAGETLGSIAATHLGHASEWKAIWKANPALENPDRIAVGTVLKLPISATGTPQYHTVAAGESLGSIAAAHLGRADRWREVWAANPALENPDRIAVGQVLMLPVVADTTLLAGEAGDSLPPASDNPTRTPAGPSANPSMDGPDSRMTAESRTDNADRAETLASLAGTLAELRAQLETRQPAPPDTTGWGANEWVESLLLAEPDHFAGRKAVARIRHREMRFVDAEARFLALHRERPDDCAVCRGWIRAREQHRPVIDFDWRHAVTHDLDGRSDRLVTPTPVRYRTVGWRVRGYHRFARHWSADLSAGGVDTALIDRVSGIPIYDFDARTGWLGLTRHFADRHTLRAAVGRTDYRPDDGSSIADKRFSRLRLAWDRETWQNRAHLSFEQGPFLGRGLATQQQFKLFKEQRIRARFEQALSPRVRAYAAADMLDYSDGNAFSDVTVGVKLRADTHRLDLSVAQGHQLGRFLDEAGGNLSLVFVPTRTVQLVDRWRRPFPFHFMGLARVRTYQANTTIEQGANPGDPDIAHLSPVNRETTLRAEAAYMHPALRPLSFGIYGDYVHFQKDAFAYNTLNEAGPTLFVQLVDGDRPCWNYLLRYEWGIRWDEDPANDHYQHQLVRARVGRTLGRHLSAELDTRYRLASQFGERGVKAVGHLSWRF